MRIQAVMAAGALALVTSAASGQQFSGGIPAGWTCVGNCGAMGANGNVSLAPGGGTQYGYVSTNGGLPGQALPGVGGSGSPTNGSILRSTPFTANAGDALEFYFNYVTSDGAGYADYAWARLLDPMLNQVALLFTARTAPTGNIVPGFAMPAPAATLVPPTVEIIGGPPSWAALGGSSNTCWSAGCGYTGWVGSTYDIASAGLYVLEFGVTNWNDTAFQSGMAFDGLQVGGVPIGSVPEPMTMALLGTGLAGLAGAARRRRKATSA